MVCFDKSIDSSHADAIYSLRFHNSMFDIDEKSLKHLWFLTLL
jgi:hypothetical protein